ncbi:YqgE/AlgH family protein [Ectothiorhodospiraceae bacterium 2226]|nr:YqgE/AlgH family protein [Ectothiorhodospiraceae bacterium 2226]
MDAVNLTDHFLIAMPGLADPNFFHSVTYICEHNSEGALGIVINRPLDLHLDEILAQMGISEFAPQAGALPVFLGGPVQPERGFVLHRPGGEWEGSLEVTPEVTLTTSRDIIEAVAQGEGPTQLLVALGYAGWGAGQLERELADNSWLSGPSDWHVIFDTPAEQRWSVAAAHLGVDVSRLSHQAGHA